MYNGQQNPRFGQRLGKKWKKLSPQFGFFANSETATGFHGSGTRVFEDWTFVLFFQVSAFCFPDFCFVFQRSHYV